MVGMKRTKVSTGYVSKQIARGNAKLMKELSRQMTVEYGYLLDRLMYLDEQYKRIDRDFDVPFLMNPEIMKNAAIAQMIKDCKVVPDVPGECNCGHYAKRVSIWDIFRCTKCRREIHVQWDPNQKTTMDKEG